MELLWPWVGSISPADFRNTETVQSALCMVCLTVLKTVSDWQQTLFVDYTNQ